MSDIANDPTRNQIALLSQNELRTALSSQISIRSVLSSLHTPKRWCHLCEKQWEQQREQQREKEDEEESEKTCEKSRENPWSSSSSVVEDTIEDFKQTGAICQEVLVRQAQVSAMIRCAWCDYHFDQIEDYSAQIYSRMLSITATAISMMGEAKLPGISTQRANQFWFRPVQNENNTARDFLDRSIAHQMFDHLSYKAARFLRPEQSKMFEVESLYQVQDRLGRTLLHLLCQKGPYEWIKRSLQIGADPSASTIYGHLPLHYAAQRGDYNICTLLLSYKGRFNIEQKDKFGRAAYVYAACANHSGVKSLLKNAADGQRMSRTSSDDSI
jgi:hypothetical protein